MGSSDFRQIDIKILEFFGKNFPDAESKRKPFERLKKILTLLEKVAPDADYFIASNQIRVGRKALGDERGFPVFYIDSYFYGSDNISDFDDVFDKISDGDVDHYEAPSFYIALHNPRKNDFKQVGLSEWMGKRFFFTLNDKFLSEALEFIEQVVSRLRTDFFVHDKFLAGQKLRPINYSHNTIFPEGINEEEPKAANLGHNKIFYGAAGTGKTYRLQQLQQAYTEQLTQQDHATFLAEKLRDLTWRDVICLVFLDEQRLLRVPEIVGHPYFRAKVTASNRTDNINQTVWGTLMRHTPAESTTVKYALKRRADLALFDKDDAGLWHLLDPQDDQLKELYELLDTLKRGAQPTETIERMSFVTFHQSYGYEDFIEGLRPVLNDDSDDGQVRYEIRRGVFVALCERARRDPEHGYALFIDEINRGNVSKILGELITLIELDKREGAPNAIRVRLPYSGDWFSVPANVSIYGSMNSADRSLTPLDTALRRRFEFVEIMPDPKLLAGRVIEGIALDELLTVMNARIELLLGRDCLLGHAYFYPVQCFDDLQTVMQQKIVPQLQEYCFEDWRKIRWVLNDHHKPEHLQFIHEHDPQARMLALFGEALDVAIQPSYALNAAAFDQIDSYRMIIG